MQKRLNSRRCIYSSVKLIVRRFRREFILPYASDACQSNEFGVILVLHLERIHDILKRVGAAHKLASDPQASTFVPFRVFIQWVMRSHDVRTSWNLLPEVRLIQDVFLLIRNPIVRPVHFAPRQYSLTRWHHGRAVML